MELAGKNGIKNVYELDVNGRHLGFTFLIARNSRMTEILLQIYIELTGEGIACVIDKQMYVSLAGSCKFSIRIVDWYLLVYNVR